MGHGGRAWRGWFPFEGELTSGRPDRKEGIYLGAELGPDHPQVQAGTPLHGANLFPTQVPELERAVLEYLDAMTSLGHTLMQGLALALGLDTDLVRRAPHRRPARPVPHLPLPARGRTRRAELGRGRAHRLRAAHDPAPGPTRRPPGARPLRLDRCPAPPRDVRVQPRRHARAHDRRALPLDPAPGAQHRRRRPPVVPVLLRPGVGRRGRARAARRRRRRARPAPAGTARTCSPSPAPTASTSGRRWVGCSPSLKDHVAEP